MDDRKRLISIMTACIVALIVMMIGMSCTQKQQQSKSTRKNNAVNTPSYNPEFYSQQTTTDIPVQTSVQEQEQQFIYQTDMLGRTVGTYPVTTAQPSQDAIAVPEIQATTAYKSMLDEYYEQKAS